MKDTHLGPIGKPLGGISVYLYRLSKLEKNSDFINSVNLLGTRKFKFWFIKQILSRKKRNFIIHLHSNYIKLLFYILCLFTKHKYSLVVHSNIFIDEYRKSNSFLQFFFKKALQKAYFIQVVNSQYKEFLKNVGVSEKKIKIKNAFLPPPLNEEPLILNTYSENILKFINEKNPVIISNSGYIRIYKNMDLYGIDMCVELTSELRKQYPNIGFVYALADKNKNHFYFREMKNKINELNIQKNFIFMTGQKEIWPLFKRADLMVRPTFMDAYGISIEEALYLGCPAVASDVCERPKGTILFENRNFKDFLDKCRAILLKKLNS